MKDGNDYSIRAVERAVSVMSVLAGSHQALSLAEIATRARLSGPTTFRLLRTLQQQGLVATEGEAGRYRLGFRILEWSNALLRQIDVIAIARPYVSLVRDQVNESTGLAIPAGDEWIRVVRAETSRPVRHSLDIGERAPLYWSSTGLVFLAGLCDEGLEAYLTRFRGESPDATPPPAPAELRTTVDRVRRHGFAEDVGTGADGVATVAFPILGHDARVVAVLAVTGSAARYRDEGRQIWIDAASHAAQEISAALGF